MRSRLTFGAVFAVGAAVVAGACGGSTTVTEVTGPDGARCQAAVSSPPSSIPAAGNRVTLTVSAARECTWSTSSEATWAAVTPSSGQGEGAITVTVEPNPAARARTGAIIVNDNRLSLSQEAAPCRYDVSPGSVRLSPESGRATFQVSATDACEWRATSNAPWARLLNSSGTSGGTVEVEVSSNTGSAPRTATLTIAERTVTIVQEAVLAPPPSPNPDPAPPGPNPNPNPNPNPSCEVSLDPSDRSFSAFGGIGSFRVDASGDCQWTASSNANWIDIVGSDRGRGSETVSYRVDVNLAAGSRAGAITLAGRTHTVRQDGAPVGPPPGDDDDDDERVEFSGNALFVVGSCPELTFFVDFRRVFTTGSTDFDGNCRRIQDGTRVSVEGRLQPDRRVRATKVKIDHDDD